MHITHAERIATSIRENPKTIQRLLNSPTRSKIYKNAVMHAAKKAAEELKNQPRDPNIVESTKNLIQKWSKIFKN